MKKKRKDKCFSGWKKGLLVTAVFLALVFGFWYFENETFRVQHIEIASDKVASQLKIAHLSDLHGQSFGADNGFLTDAVTSFSPDLVVVTGDMYTGGDDTGQATALSLLKTLAASFPVYYVPGEHDNQKNFFESLTSAGVEVLRGESKEVDIGANALMVYGCEYVYNQSGELLQSNFGSPNPRRLNLLLAHLPDFEMYADWGADLSFCGDTHGGIMQLPYFGPVIYDGLWLPRANGYAGPIYDKGLFTREGRYMVVSAGLGNYPYPVRLFNRPELVTVTISPKEAD